MANYDWYTGWGWIFWFGFVFLVISGVGNWGYTYRAHRKYSDFFPNKALDILNERYARGDVTHDEFAKMKLALKEERTLSNLKPA